MQDMILKAHPWYDKISRKHCSELENMEFKENNLCIEYRTCCKSDSGVN